MKESEKIKEKAKHLESDFAYMSYMNKALRQERLERFSSWLPELTKSKNVISVNFSDVNKCTVNTEDFGIIDYFPKANKVLIRKENKWITGGLRWLRSNIIKI